MSYYATDWGSNEPGNNVAEKARSVSTQTWTSPANEEFFRKDIYNANTGAGPPSKSKIGIKL